MRYHYVRSGKKHGPVGIDDLRQLLRSGGLSEADLALADGASDWVPVGQIEGIKATGAVPPIPASALSNKWLWWAALWPICALVIYDLMVALGGPRMMLALRDPATTRTIDFALFILPVLLFCDFDRRYLTRSDRLVGKWWPLTSLISPIIYIIIRVRKFGGSYLPLGGAVLAIAANIAYGVLDLG